MKKRILSLTLVLTALFAILSLGAFAAEADVADEEVVWYDDGSYMVITYSSSDSTTRALNSKSGSAVYTFYTSNDVAQWKAVLTGSFTYDGTTSTCTASSVTVTIYDSSWYVVSKSASKSGNTATAEVTMGHKFLGVTVSKKTYNLSLTCDKDGNLS